MLNEMLFSIMWEYLIIFLGALLAEKMLEDLTLVIIELYSSKPGLTFYSGKTESQRNEIICPKSVSQLAAELSIESRSPDS